MPLKDDPLRNTLYPATLVNGEQIFPAMPGAVRAAQRTLTFETCGSPSLAGALEVAMEQTRLFERDLMRCKRITYEQWRARPRLLREGPVAARDPYPRSPATRPSRR